MGRRIVSVFVSLASVVLLVAGCSNPKEEFRATGTEFAQGLVNKDFGSLEGLKARGAFGQGTGEFEALRRTMERDCGTVRGVSEKSLDTGPSVDADAIGTMVFTLDSDKPCSLRVRMTLKNDKVGVSNASINAEEAAGS